MSSCVSSILFVTGIFALMLTQPLAGFPGLGLHSALSIVWDKQCIVVFVNKLLIGGQVSVLITKAVIVFLCVTIYFIKRRHFWSVQVYSVYKL